jgi:hypothetical protein
MGTKEEITERQKPYWFVRHIQKHLSEMKVRAGVPLVVKCKICDKSIDEIAEETWQEL